MKKLLPLATISLETFQAFYKDPASREQLDDAKTKVLFLPKIPKTCYESQERAQSKLINQACGIEADAEGNLDPEKYYLEIAATSGTARSLRYFLGGVVPVKLKNGNRTVYDPSLAPDIVLLPDDSEDGLWTSETRLNSFLKKLGSALRSTKRRGEPLGQPDWEHRVTRLKEYIAHGCWCNSITVDGERWPPLCVFSAPALARFLTLCKNPLWKKIKGANLPEKPRTLETMLRRELGLVRIPRGRILHVEKKFGVFRFG